jgi:hypothetical protein
MVIFINNRLGGMIVINMYKVNRSATYLDVDYKVLQVLDNDLLLVVTTSDFENGVFPLQTYVLPDYEIIEKTKNMRHSK